MSVLPPDLIAPQILRNYPTVVRPLDRVETSALCFLVAFQSGPIRPGIRPGHRTPNRRLVRHLPPQMRIPSLPGPDGIGRIAPLVSTGLVNPEDVPRTVATFTGGFKREHGAFKFGVLAKQNHGSHYGFIEQGVVFSKLQPGLATVVVLDDGSIDMKTWRDTDNLSWPGSNMPVRTGCRSSTGR